MTKHEFLKQLKAELAGLPGTERRRQLDYYAELLDDMVEDGMDPEMAVERLGPVSEIANAIFRDNPQARKGSGRLGLLLGVSCGAAALVCMAGLLFWTVSRAKPQEAVEETRVSVAPTAPTEAAQLPTQPQTEQEEPEEFGFDSDRHWSNAYSSVGFYDIPISDVTSLDLSWMKGEVTLKPWLGEVIRLHETAVEEAYALQYGVENHTLYIQSCAPGHYTGMPDKTLTVWIPAQLAESLEELHAQTFSASLTVQELSATRMNLQSVSGLTELYEVEAEEANFSSVSGDMTWDGVIQAVTMRTTSGNIQAIPGQAPEEMSLTTLSGDIELYMPQGVKFSIYFDTTSGQMVGNYPLYGTEGGKQYYIGSSDLEYTVNTVSGNLAVNQRVYKDE